MSVPREPLRLEGTPEAPRLITHQTRKDYTQQMTRWARQRVRELEKEDLYGFILKTKSPSCGMMNVKIYNEKSQVTAKGSGIFAGIFMTHFPLIPVEDSDRIHDLVCRENYIERMFVQHRWRFALQEKTIQALVDFHTRHKMILLAHSEKHYRLMGKLAADAGNMPVQDAYEQYQDMLINALSMQSTPSRHVNVLQHMAGYFKKQLSDKEKHHLHETIDHYRNGQVPLLVPVTLINYYVRQYDQAYLRSQYYLNPHHPEPALKYHV